MTLVLRRAAGGLAVLVMVASCGPDYTKYEAHLVETQAEAGTATIAVTAVEPWSDVADDLMPAFELTGTQALTKVLPQTQVVLSRVLDSLGAGLEVNLPTSSFSRTQTTTEATGQPPTSNTTTEQAERSGAVPTGDLVAPETRKAADLPGVLGADDLKFENDPILEYQTALALFQEVKVLNRYLDSAALNYCAKPYLVRLQIGVTPYARRQSYDVYTRVSFFAGDSDESGHPTPPPIGCERRVQGSLPQVIPLLVTDNLELSRGSRVAETVRQLGLAARGSYSGVGAGGEVQRLTDQIEAVAGNSLNSLTSVTRLADNTLQARFGAANDPAVLDYERSMVTRNYNVTLVVLVPDEVTRQPMPWLNLVAKTDFRDAKRGTTLATGREEGVVRRLRATAETYALEGWAEKNDRDLYQSGLSMALHIFQNREAGFCSEYGKALKTKMGAGCLRSNPQIDTGSADELAPAIWTEIAGITSAFDFSNAYVALPRAIAMTPPPYQTALLVDDTKGATTLRLRDGTGFTVENVAAHLTFETVRPMPATRHTSFHFAPDLVEANDGGRSLTMRFPSFAVLGFRTNNIKSAELQLTLVPDQRWQLPNDDFEVVKCVNRYRERTFVLLAEEQPPASADRRAESGPCNRQTYPGLWRTIARELDLGFDLTVVGGGSVVANGGDGTVRLVMAAEAGGAGAISVAVTASGGQIIAAVPASGLDGATNTVLLSAAPGQRTAVDLTFKNLVPGKKLAFKAVGKRSGIETGDTTVEIDIAEGKAAPK